MTDEEQTVLLIRGTIAGLSDAEQLTVKAFAEVFRESLKRGGAHAVLALSLVGAELAAQP